MTRTITTILAVAIYTATSLPVAAQAKGSRLTRDFVAEAAQTDTFEMMEAASALAESHDPAVVAFAQEMMRDHAATTKTLNEAVSQAGLELPAKQMNGVQAAFLASLQSARGATFDRVYWHQQALGHRAALVAMQRYAADGDTATVKRAAMDSIPIVQKHLAQAERMDRVGAGE